MQNSEQFVKTIVRYYYIVYRFISIKKSIRMAQGKSETTTVYIVFLGFAYLNVKKEKNKYYKPRLQRENQQESQHNVAVPSPC